MISAVFESHISLKDPSCTEIEFEKQIDTDSTACYSVALCEEKIVGSVGSSLMVYDINGSKEKESVFDGIGIPCVRNAGAGKLAILNTDDSLEREVRISKIEDLSSINSIVCKLKQKNSDLTHISVSSTHIAAADTQNKNVTIFNMKGGQALCLGIGRVQRPYGVLLIEDFVLVTDRDNKCISKYRLEHNSEPVWTCYGLQNVNGICSDKNGLIYVASAAAESSGKIFLISPGGDMTSYLN